MTLQQLRFLTAIVENELNITAAAARLKATQPAVSRQLLLLERELGFQIFSRNGRALVRMTDAGQRVLAHARRALREAQNIKHVSEELSDPQRGELRIGTTHTEARYVLPRVIHPFRARFPQVRLSLHPGTPEQIAERVRLNQIDLAVVAGASHLLEELVVLPCYESSRRLVVPASHPLASARALSLARLAAYPLASHASTTTDRWLHELFVAAGIEPQIVLTTPDAELIKTYVELGFAVGIIADVAFDPEKDQQLVAREVSHLFPAAPTWVGFSGQALIRQYIYEFLAMLAPGLTRERIDRARDAALTDTAGTSPAGT